MFNSIKVCANLLLKARWSSLHGLTRMLPIYRDAAEDQEQTGMLRTGSFSIRKTN